MFSDMFGFSQPSNSDTSSSALPTIQCFDDPADLEKFMQAIHDYRGAAVNHMLPLFDRIYLTQNTGFTSSLTLGRSSHPSLRFFG